MTRFTTLQEAIDQAIAPALSEGEYDLEAIAREVFTYKVDTDENGNELVNTAGFEQTVTGDEFWVIVERHEVTSYLVVSATTSDRTPGVEVSDPECPINIEDHPAALAWAQEQGWGNDPDELLFVVPAGSDEADEIPDGLPVYRLTVPATTYILTQPEAQREDGTTAGYIRKWAPGYDLPDMVHGHVDLALPGHEDESSWQEAADKELADAGYRRTGDWVLATSDGVSYAPVTPLT